MRQCLKEDATSWEGVKSKALNRIRSKRSVYNCIGYSQLYEAMSHSSFSIILTFPLVLEIIMDFVPTQHLKKTAFVSAS